MPADTGCVFTELIHSLCAKFRWSLRCKCGTGTVMYQLLQTENASTDVDMDLEGSQNRQPWQHQCTKQPELPCYAAEGLGQLLRQNKTPRKVKVVGSPRAAPHCSQASPKCTEDALDDDDPTFQPTKESVSKPKTEKRTLRKRTGKGYATIPQQLEYSVGSRRCSLSISSPMWSAVHHLVCLVCTPFSRH